MKGFCRVLYLFVSGHQNWNKKKKLSSKIIIEKLLNGKYEKHLAQQNTVINIRTIENASRKLDFLLTTAVIILLKTLGSKVLYIGYTFSRSLLDYYIGNLKLVLSPISPQ